MKNGDFIMDADTEDERDLTDTTADLTPTKDILHSVLEPMNIKPLLIPKEIIEEMKASYDEVCVNDFGDIYHLSEEERRESMRFYEIFKDMKNCKSRYRDIPQYVIACRIALKCLYAVAETNWVYEEKDFIEKVLNRKIKVSGLKIPKYIGKGKKDVNWKLIGEYILDESKDPSDLQTQKNEAFWDVPTEDDIENVQKDLDCSLEELVNSSGLSEEEFSKIDPYMDDVTGENFIIPLSKKQQKKMLRSKNGKTVLLSMKELKRQKRDSRFSTSYAYELTQDSFEEIKMIDRKRQKLNGVPEFEGEVFNKKDVDRYLGRLEEYELSHVKKERDGRMYTLEEIDELELKDELERNGMDIKKFYNYKEERKKMKRRKKRDMKRVKRIKMNLAEAERRYQERYEERDSKGKVNHKKKKSKKKKKQMKNFDNKFTGGFNDYVKQMESWDD